MPACGGWHRYDEALYAAERALALNEAVADAWYNKALVLESLDDHDGAQLAYEEAIALAPDRFEPLLFEDVNLNAELDILSP